MIVQSFEPKKKKVPHLYTIPPNKHTQQTYPVQITEYRPNNADKDRAKQFGVAPEEFVRRDNIVRQLYLDNPFRCGEVVRASDEGVFATYGRLSIRQIYKTYHDFTTSEAKDWPENDKPYIIAAQPEKGEAKLLLCRADTLQRFTEPTT